MSFPYILNKNIYYSLNNTFIKLSSLRYLEKNLNGTSTYNNYKKKQLIELYIIIAVLAAIIIIIMGGYALYRKYVEKNLMQEIEQEDDYIENLESSSKSSSLQEDQSYPYSYNNREIPRNQYSDSEIRSKSNETIKSVDYNHEERMERIRKKYGNSMMIKILLKKKLEEIQYNDNLNDYGDNCTICMNGFTNNILIYRTPCEHIFHKDCFNKYLKNIKSKDKLICPNCNQNLIINKKFLTLRTKVHEVNVKKNEEINTNKNKEITSKYIEIDDDNDIKNNKEAIIVVKKKKDEDENININDIKEKNDKKIKVNIGESINELKYKHTDANQDGEKDNNNNLFSKKKTKFKKENKLFIDLENQKVENEIDIQKDTNNNSICEENK